MFKFIKNLKRFLLTDPRHCDSSWCSFNVKSEYPVPETPIYYILDPKQNMKCTIDDLISQITGPFHNRDSAYEYLRKNKEKFSTRAAVLFF
jgi:hypothetical protein